MKRLWNPAALTAVALLVYLGAVLVQAGGDPLSFVRIGSRYQQAGSVDGEGYDGQFVYFIARDLDPDRAAPYLDVPAYRYQRILLPLLARALSFGSVDLLPWALIAIGVVSHIGGVALVARLLEAAGASSWYALVYGLWAGLMLAVRLDLPEPLAYALVAAGIAAGEERPAWKWIALSLAVFAKEVTLLFALGQLSVYLLNRNWRRAAGLGVALLPYAFFQLWLYQDFGAFGLGSGGAMATPFELVPYMGLLRIGAYGWLPLFVFAVVVVPFFYFPALWGLVRSLRAAMEGRFAPHIGFMFWNALVIPFLPFSTVREPGGLFRFGTGLVLAHLLFAAGESLRRPLRLSLAWLALSAILVNS